MLLALYNRNFEEKDISVLAATFDFIKKQNIDYIIFDEFYNHIKRHLEIPEPTALFHAVLEIPKEVSFFISLGGDGTMLDAVCFVGKSGIPIMGVNLGRLGFLAAIQKEQVEAALQSLLTGAYSLDSRSLLHLEANVPLFGKTKFALNEFTIHRKDSSSMVKIHTFLNGAFLNTYWCDGLIVSTPTGSTGYSLSCNGPVVFPQSSSFVITPVAPHNLNVRSMVVPDSSIISFEVEGRADNFLCTLDSRMEGIDNNVQIAVRKEDFSIKLIRPNNHNFLNTLRKKLYWGIDSRN